jgi:hypothetical protein
MSTIKQIIRIVLVVHGLLNLAQGTYCVLDPAWFLNVAGKGFEGSSQQALQSIGNAQLCKQ